MVAVVAAIIMAPRLSFEYRTGELEPTYEEWNRVNTVVRKAFSDRNRRNPAYVPANWKPRAFRSRLMRSDSPVRAGSSARVRQAFTTGLPSVKLHR